MLLYSIALKLSPIILSIVPACRMAASIMTLIIRFSKLVEKTWAIKAIIEYYLDRLCMRWGSQLNTKANGKQWVFFSFLPTMCRRD